MKKTQSAPSSSSTDISGQEGQRALGAYGEALSFLTQRSQSWPWQDQTPVELPFISALEGVAELYQSMSAVAPAVPDAADEEWNPLSQRPHSPLPPPIADELGMEISSLKEAIDAFTTLSHEMMHVALAEPFFVGAWRPRQLGAFQDFFLLSEGFCFFFADILISGVVRARLPDGELALERQTPSNAHFHPVRAFAAMGLRDPEEILEIYLKSFAGRGQPLIKGPETSPFAAALALRTYTFYTGSQPYLKDLYKALRTSGVLSEFPKRFAAIPDLPSFLPRATAELAGEADLMAYFRAFYQSGLSSLKAMSPFALERLRCRRMLQMRAYYGLAVRWCLREEQIASRKWSPRLSQRLEKALDKYLDGLEELLRQLAADAKALPLSELEVWDAFYEREVRSTFQAHDAWTAFRWLIAPRRATGHLHVGKGEPFKMGHVRPRLLETAAFIVDELTLSLGEESSPKKRAELLGQIQEVAALGALAGRGSDSQVTAGWKKLQKILSTPRILPIWSLPLANFNPLQNQFRELLFSYK